MCLCVFAFVCVSVYFVCVYTIMSLCATVLLVCMCLPKWVLFNSMRCLSSFLSVWVFMCVCMLLCVHVLVSLFVYMCVSVFYHLCVFSCLPVSRSPYSIFDGIGSKPDWDVYGLWEWKVERDGGFLKERSWAVERSVSYHLNEDHRSLESVSVVGLRSSFKLS